jgi:predicted esterase YcpF (UPF0227 family)
MACFAHHARALCDVFGLLFVRPHNFRMTTTHLLYLHGFGSSPSSKKARLMAEAVAQRHPSVVWACPALNASPKQAMIDVLNAVADWPKDTMAVVGSSLGGFYATWLAERLGCKAVLLNPAVHPARDLAAYIGQNNYWHDPQQSFLFDPTYVGDLRAQEIARISHPERYFAVIAKGDEVLEWREMTAHYPGVKIKLHVAGDHALSDFDQHIDEVLGFLALI